MEGINYNKYLLEKGRKDMAKKYNNWDNVTIENGMVTVICRDLSMFSYRSEFVKGDEITNDIEFGEELREKIFANR